MLLNELDSYKAKVSAFAALAALAVVMGLYLAGYFFLYKIGEHPYAATPKTIIDYWVYYGDQPLVKKWLSICSFAGFVPAIIVIGLCVAPINRKLHGDARFATTAEIKRNKLLGQHGFIIGKWKGKFLMLAGQLGALLAAPPRSGKGVGVVQPNMLSWPDSVVLLDVRQESFRLTSGFRATFSEVHLFNPVDPDLRTMQWNPLDYVSDDPMLRVNDLQKIGNMLSPDPADGDPFWPASCRTLFLGLALYVFETPSLPRTFGEIVRQIMFGEGETVGEHWKEIIETRDQSPTPLSSACKAALYDFIFTSGNTQSSIRKTFTAKLELWLNPLIDAATCRSSLDLRRMRRDKISVYIGIKPKDLDYLSLIINLFAQQIVELNMDQMPEDNPELKYQLGWIMDEFTAPGRMPVIAKAIGYLGGYNIRPFIIVQSISQLVATYGPEVAKTIIECLGAEIVYAPKNKEHARTVSEMLGDTTIKVKTHSRPKFDLKGGSTSTSEQKRALLLPQEVRQIGKKRQIVFIENMNAILCEKVFYYKEKVFKKRLLPPYVQPQAEYTPPPPRVAKPKPKPKADEVTEVNGQLVKFVDREIEVKDIDNLDKLSLTDYNIDFAKIEIPDNEPATDEEMKELFSSFVNSIAD
ncbi:type IV secretory system conjugative DNA transfer family protein [Pseudomonas eucalypticola]|uniref:Type IV secretory system conjugative DNA transfer family protein n=1 Tax=Pseudomonas eucalypticola TaxID=2599595 RepID=A0A7D5DC14_9PSED|nr:type IV secretory system conjugative DNA transfer family protein [Pseudomonas eucalypticola]QKZ07832.1 type IV secretory system conjugative DNA transfer family protein [Pseudomonas eucalypticola]